MVFIGGEMVWREAKWVKYMVIEGNYTLGGEHTMQYADVILKFCIPENYAIKSRLRQYI